MNAGVGRRLRVEVLGPVRAWWGDRELILGPPRQRAVLGVLAMRANRPVSRDELVDAVWGDRPPASAENGVHSYVAGLRRAMEPDRAARAPARALVSSGSGYVLHLEPGGLDAEVFGCHLETARRRRAAADLAAALRSFDAAVELWRGQAYSGIPGPFAEVERARLVELATTAAEERAEVLLGLGRAGDAATDLAGLAQRHPLRERLRGLLMLALYRCGRQAEALAVFQDLRRLLVRELAVEPGPDLARLYQQILAADPALTAGGEPAPDRPGGPDGPVGAADPLGAGRAAPAQLPHDVSGFTGRADALARLHGLLPDAGQAGGTVPIAVIHGAGGVGKTALAVHFAHQVAGRFGDGQLYVNLRGFDPGQAPVPPGEALGHLLRSLGTDPRRIPAGLDEQAAMYRSLLAGRRVLVLLDNARAAEQVRPLLPGDPHCPVIVTSRDRLAALAARDGARQVALDVLEPDESLALLARTVGSDRVEAEPDAARELAHRCGHLPLALRIAAERAGADRAGTLGALARELADERGRLDALAAGDDETTAARAVFSWSYRALARAEARTFRLLGLHAGPAFGVSAAAALTGSTPGQARRRLDALVAGHLLERTRPDHYRFHDLLRLYAAERANADEPEEARRQAIRRVLRWYLHTAGAANRALIPGRRPIDLGDGPPDAVPPARFATYDEALHWCDTERANLVGAVHQAAEAGEDAVAWRLPVVLWAFYNLRKCWADWLSTTQVGLAAARRLGEPEGEASALNSLGIACYDLRRVRDAFDYHQQALAAWRRLGDRRGEAATLNNLGDTLRALGRYHDAVGHYEQARTAHREAGNRRGEGFVLHNLGETYRDLDRFVDALEHTRQALTIFREVGDRREEGSGLHNIGETCRRLGRLDDALRYLRQALTVRRGIGDRQGEAATLRSLGEALHAAGHTEDALRSWDDALAIFSDLGAPEAGEVRDRLRSSRQRLRSPGLRVELE